MTVRPERKWERRIERAQELAATHPYAAEALRFYESLVSCQRPLYEGFKAAAGTGALAPGALRQELAPAALLPSFPSFLARIGEIAPPPLAQSAVELATVGEGHRRQVLADLLQTAGATLAPGEALLGWTFLQPHAEALADRAGPQDFQGAPRLCPLCGGRPQVGVLRPQGDGGKRSLVCSLCATEWPFRRIVCPTCGEEDVDQLPYFFSPDLPNVRVEACDSCHHYLKTIDMTKEGRAVPVVDELAAIPLSLWAAENGYVKEGPDLLGL